MDPPQLIIYFDKLIEEQLREKVVLTTFGSELGLDVFFTREIITGDPQY